MANNLVKRGLFIALAPPESDRAPDMGRLDTLATKLKCPNKVFKNVTAAFSYLLKQAEDKDIPVFVIGSLYTAAEVYRFLNIKPGD
jgi:folylpolyglutamate synthase/dihydropteroate synthase